MKKTTDSALGYCGRFLVFLFAGGAITCSVLTAVACDFFALSDGVPQYATGSEDCPFYDQQFWNESSNDAIFVTVQLPAVVAPFLAAVALFMNFVDFVCGRCDFILSILLYFAACFIQASTFVMYFRVKNDCSGDDSNDCRWPIGVILSIAASASYLICFALVCCFPRPNPCFQNSQPVGTNDGHVEKGTFEAAEEEHDDGDATISTFRHGLQQPTYSE